MKRHSNHNINQPHRRGLSLVEVMVSSVLLATLAIGALTTVGAITRSRSTMNDRMKAYDLAEQMLSEVMQAAYVDFDEPENPIGKDTGEATPRSNFDDVDDFDLWNSTPPVDRAGTAVPSYVNWQRQVFVEWVTPGILLPAMTDTGLKQITVRVTDPLGKQLELKGLRTSLGAVEQKPTKDGTVVTWVGIQLQVGNNSQATFSGTNLVNHASD